MKYYRGAAAALEAAGVPAAASTGSAESFAAAELVQRRRVLNIMQKRMADYAAGQNTPHTTHQWHQQHLREAGLALPPVVWGARSARAQVGPQAVARAGARERHCARKRQVFSQALLAAARGRAGECQALARGRGACVALTFRSSAIKV